MVFLFSPELGIWKNIKILPKQCQWFLLQTAAACLFWEWPEGCWALCTAGRRMLRAWGAAKASSAVVSRSRGAGCNQPGAGMWLPELRLPFQRSQVGCSPLEAGIGICRGWRGRELQGWPVEGCSWDFDFQPCSNPRAGLAGGVV